MCCSVSVLVIMPGTMPVRSLSMVMWVGMVGAIGMGVLVHVIRLPGMVMRVVGHMIVAMGVPAAVRMLVPVGVARATMLVGMLMVVAVGMDVSGAIRMGMLVAVL